MESVCLITGGTRGLGLAMGKGFSRAGYRVAINYRSDEEQAKKAKGELPDALCIKGDVTKASDREALLNAVIAHFGRIDILINNAGIITRGRLLDGTNDDFEKVVETDLHAPIFLSRLFAQHLVSKTQPGLIINLTTIGAHRGGNLAYCAAKAGLLIATKSMAKELGPHQIRVNCISPGYFLTDLNRASRDEGAWDKMIKKVPLGREGQHEEIAEAALFLASNGYMTGAEIVVDGGVLT